MIRQRRVSMLGGCWTLLDTSLDAPVPWVAARGVESSAESARHAACRCHRGWRAVHLVTGSAAGVHELAADPGDSARVMERSGC